MLESNLLSHLRRVDELLNANVILISKIVNVLTPRRSHLEPKDLKPLFGEMNSESIVLYPLMYHNMFLKYTTLF